MIQIFEIVQDGGTGFWSENKDLIAAFGVFISFLAAAASIWAIRINKKTLDEIKTQRKQSYLPFLTFGNVQFDLIYSEINQKIQFPMTYVEQIQTGKIKEKPIVTPFSLHLYNCGLGPARNIEVFFQYNYEELKLKVQSLFNENQENPLIMGPALKIEENNQKVKYTIVDCDYFESFTPPNMLNLKKNYTHIYSGNYDDSYVEVVIPLSFWVLFRFANFCLKLKNNKLGRLRTEIESFNLYATITYEDVVGEKMIKKYLIQISSTLFQTSNSSNIIKVIATDTIDK